MKNLRAFFCVHKECESFYLNFVTLLELNENVGPGVVQRIPFSQKDKNPFYFLL